MPGGCADGGLEQGDLVGGRGPHDGRLDVGCGAARSDDAVSALACGLAVLERDDLEPGSCGQRGIEHGLPAAALSGARVDVA